VEPEGSLSASERGLVGCLVLYSEDGFEDTAMRGLKRGLERTQFACLLSKPSLNRSFALRVSVERGARVTRPFSRLRGGGLKGGLSGCSSLAS